MPLLRLKGIGKSFSGHRVLEGVDFELEAGEVHLLAGENGAGKSTLIKIIAGVHHDYDGAMELEGRIVRFRSPYHAAEHGIAVIHQELSLIPSMNVRDNLFLGRESRRFGHWMEFESERKRSTEVLARLELDVDPLAEAGSFPVSIQQQLEIAKALMLEARVIIMDEPTSALTVPEVEKLVGVIGRLRAQGCGIIYISHKMGEIYRIADRITVLRDGRKIGSSPASGLPEKKLVEWMVGREVPFPEKPSAPTRGEVRLSVSGFSVQDPSGSPIPAVQNASFVVHGGEILGLAGLQGSGTSELLHALFGAYGRITGGTIALSGRPYRPTSPAHALNRGIALLTNDRKGNGLVVNASIRENVCLPCLRRLSPGQWVNEGAARRLAETMCNALQVKRRSIDQEVSVLSGGNQQKVVLAKWLGTEPRLLLLDDPTRGVDVGAKQEIHSLIRQWAGKGISVVLISSELPEFLNLSDRVLVFHRGRITKELAGDLATPEAVLTAAMAGGSAL